MLLIDDREIVQHPELPGMFTVPTAVERLGAGDFCFLDRDRNLIGIERVTINNFFQTLHSGELEEKLNKCLDLYATTILLLQDIYFDEGNRITLYRRTEQGRFYCYHILPTATFNQLASALDRLGEYNIQLRTSHTLEESVKVIEAIYGQRKEPEEQHHLMKRPPKPIPPRWTGRRDIALLTAMCPRMPVKVANALLEKYGTIWMVLNAPLEGLLEVRGMGQGLLRNLREGIGIP